MAAEEAGAAKAKEGLRLARRLRQVAGPKLGKAYVRFGEPFRLGEALRRGDDQRNAGRPAAGRSTRSPSRSFQRLNRITPVTAPALVTLALLGVRTTGALTLQEVQDVVEPLLDYVERRALPTTALGELHTVHRASRRCWTRSCGPAWSAVMRAASSPSSTIAPGQHPVAAYYRNSAIHWFVNRAIVELGLMVATQEGLGDAITRGLAAAFAWRDLLKFEFFFSEKPVFEEEIRAEARLLDPTLRERVAGPAAPPVAPLGAARAGTVPGGASRAAGVPGSLFHRRRPAGGAPAGGAGRRSGPSWRSASGSAGNTCCRSGCATRNASAASCSATRSRWRPIAACCNPAPTGWRSTARRRFAEETAAAVAAVAAIGALDERRRHGAQAPA